MQAQILEGFRLSPQQRHLWLLQQDSVAYRVQAAIRVEGQLKAEVLEAALDKVIQRHEVFRTIFHRQPGIKLPIQVIADKGNLSWERVNLRGLSYQAQSAKVEQLFQDFKLEKQLNLFASLVTLADDLHILLIMLPALCADSWTLKNLVKEISQIYTAGLKGESLSQEEPIQYLQFSEWQNELLEDEDAEAAKEYWQEQNCPAIILPFEANSQTYWQFKPDVYHLNIHAAIAKKVEALASLYKTTTSEFLFACWQTLLWRLTGQSEIAISTVYSGQKYEELHDVLGLLAKWLPIRCTLQKNLKFSEVLSRLDEKLREVEQWQDYLAWEENSNNLVDSQISFEFENWSETYNAGDVCFSIDKQYVCFDRFKIKLSCVQQAASLTAEFHYDTARFDPETIQCLAEQFLTLIESAVNYPEGVIDELNLLSDRTRHHLLVELNRTPTYYPPIQAIHHLFEQQVERTPDSIAVVFENQQLTYAELNQRANQLAHYLQQQGVQPEVIVGIYVERSLYSIIALLAILKAGAAYLPLDAALPKESLAFRLQDAQVPILLTQQKLLNREDAPTQTVVYLDADWETIAQASTVNPSSELTPDNLAYILYTSGSTGQPKGVAVEHRQILNYLHAILEKLELPTGGSFAMVSTFAADLGNTVIFPALCTGGCLHILSQERASDPEALAQYCQRHPIDCLKIVPSHLSSLATSRAFSSVLPRQCLVLGGEAASWDLIDKIQQHAPNCRILNHYGPTETTVGVLTYAVKHKQASYNAQTVPIGCAIANTQVYILNAHLQPVPIGIPGELYIGGAGVARGYLNRPELTAEKFIAINLHNAQPTRVYKTGDKARYLPDGNIEFLGRVDNQVKIRGFRVELGEIEAVLAQHPGVQQAIVSLLPDDTGNPRLVGYAIPNPKHPASISDLRHFLLQKFPEYMVPSAFVLLKTFPLTPNGKVNRSALPAPESTRPELAAVYVAPRTPVEAKLVEIWAKLLRVEKVGIYDNFFDLGGHSLLITQLLAQVRETFKVNLSLPSLFAQPTIANIAEKITLGTAPAKAEIDLKAEAILDETIRPHGIPHNPDIPPSAILLTGATGFLGSFLLYELLQQTQADIYCLVRSETLESAQKKIQNSLEFYLLWDESFKSRIIPVLGDLSQPLLGLSPTQFQDLASQLDVIYHNGAAVNFTYPYSMLKAPNVLGTQEVLRLASQIKIKPVHFISTISVVYPNNPEIEVVREQHSLDDARMPSDGYVQTKWVAEKLVTIARERGLPICIYRPGRISGHSKTGACNPDDHTYRMIKGCIQLGKIPAGETPLNLTPVDYVSQAIVYLSQQKESTGKAFHLVNPQPLPLSEMIDYIRSLGYAIESVSYNQWFAQLMNTGNSPENALYPLLSIFSEEKNAESKEKTSRPTITFDCQNTLNGLAETSIACPPINAEVFRVYFSYLIQNGFLNSPVN